MASGHVNRTNRPNTWLHRPSLRREDSPCQPGAVHTWPIATLPQEFMSAMPGKADNPEPTRMTQSRLRNSQDSDQFARSFAFDCVIGSTAITTPQSLRQARELDHGQTFQSNPTQQPVAWSSWRQRFRKSVRQRAQGRFRASWRKQDQEAAQAATLRLSQAGRFAAATGVQRRD